MAGAFAGYFLLFLASYLIIKKMMFELPDRSEVWSVKVNFYDENGHPVDKDRNKPDVTFYPHAEIENGQLYSRLAVDVIKDFYKFPGISLSAYSDTSKLFIPSDSNDELLDPGVVRQGGASTQKKGNWEYDFERKILTYSAKIKLIKEVPASKETSSIFKMDSIPKPQ